MFCVSLQDYLADKPVYEAVFRPSRQGLHNITMTWKVDDGQYAHVGTHIVCVCMCVCVEWGVM